jgi:hypothetical protein
MDLAFADFMYCKTAKKLPPDWKDHPEMELGPTNYRTHFTALVQRLLDETSCKIALLSLPPVGEDRNSAVNQRVQEMVAVIREAVLLDPTRITYLPLNESCIKMLEAHDSQFPTTKTQFPTEDYIKRFMLMVMAAGARYFCCRWMDWGAIGRKQGLELTSDTIHLTEEVRNTRVFRVIHS